MKIEKTSKIYKPEKLKTWTEVNEKEKLANATTKKIDQA